MKINTIIYDLDGTLLYTLEDLKNSVNYALEKNGYPLRTLEEIRVFVGNGVRVLMTRALPADSSLDELEQSLQDFKEHYAIHMNDTTKVYDGIIDMLTKVKKQGYKTAVVSNKSDSAVKILCQKYFNHLIDLAIGTPPEAKKPDPYSVNQAITLLSSSKEQSIYIGDSEIDILTAKNAKIPCIGVSWGFRNHAFLSEHQCEYIIDHPMDLFIHL